MASLPQIPANNPPSPSPCWNHVSFFIWPLYCFLYILPDDVFFLLESCSRIVWVLPLFSKKRILGKEHDLGTHISHFIAFLPWIMKFTEPSVVILVCNYYFQLWPGSLPSCFLFSPTFTIPLEFSASSWIYSRPWAASWSFFWSCIVTYGSCTLCCLPPASCPPHSVPWCYSLPLISPFFPLTLVMTLDNILGILLPSPAFWVI